MPKQNHMKQSDLGKPLDPNVHCLVSLNRNLHEKFPSLFSTLGYGNRWEWGN
jgi:hypothetical protein